jgi:C4-dicarboxylate transporter DctM subunit
MNGGKEAGWGLFLIIIIIGGIYGGVFTPTEAAAVAAVYAFFIAVFVYRDMGPMAGRRWLRETMRAARRAHIGFSGHGLCAGVLLRLDGAVLLRHRRLGNVTGAGRANLGLALVARSSSSPMPVARSAKNPPACRASRWPACRSGAATCR